MPKKPGIDKRGISIRGRGTDVLDRQLCNRIRERLSLSESQLSDKTIRTITRLQNSEISDWIVNNTEAFTLPDMGVLAASKHLPKEFRDTKEEDMETIESIKVSDLRRKQLLKRYNVDVSRRINLNQLVEYQRLLPNVNIHSYFYTYRIMWFNQRNCRSKKARSFIFNACGNLNKKLHDKVIEGKEYYEWNFQFFYKYKLGSEW